MRLNKIDIKNIRIYGDREQSIRFDETKNVTVLLGDNGTGKTTILYAISILLSQFFKAFPGIKSKTFKGDDVRVENVTRKNDYLHVAVQLSNNVFAEMYEKGNSNDTPYSYTKELVECANHYKNTIDNNEVVALPIFAYYGTERGQIKAPIRRRDFSKVFPRWDSYIDALESSTNFKRFFTWFERNEDEERREREKLWDKSYSSYTLDVVRKALNKLDSKLSNPRVEISPLRFVMDDTSEPDNVKEIRIEQMSDGYRIMIAMVADIASRMAEANPSKECSGLNDPLETTGIILIDEIDLHLHPLWQRNVIRQLNSIFPNIQFIVTTHSPNVILGALDITQVVKLDNGVILSDFNLSEFSRYDVSLLLLSDLFGLDNVRTNEYKKFADEEEKLLDKATLTENEKSRLKELTYILTEYGYASGK